MSVRLAGATVATPTLAAVALVLAAVVAALVPLPAAFVERVYSTGAYPFLQRSLTSVSNRAPIALIDVVLLTGIAWIVCLAAGVRRVFRSGPGPAVRKLIGGVILPAAALYLWFVILWGFNYRRLPLDAKLSFDARAAC